MTEVDSSINKNSSLSTSLAMFNSMVGGAMLTFPILYRTAGIATSTVVLMISGIVSFITCRIYVLHMSDDDKDVEWTIRRILGVKWQRFFRLITGFYLILLCIIYIDLIVDQLYSVVFFFAKDSIAAKDAFAFDMFSTQWLTLILFLPFIYLVFIKNLNRMIKLSQYGAYSALLYFIFVVYKFIEAVANDKIDLDKITWISQDIGNLAGTCALAFTIHTMVITFVKPNQHQQNNVRDVGVSYILGFTLYQLIGVLGAFTVSGNEACKQTFVDCYLTEGLILVVEISYLFGRVTVFPCTLQVSRTRLIQLFFDKVQQKHFKIFNIGFVIFATIFSILSPFLPITLMMNIVGALICYLFIYLIPSAIHYKCLYKKKKTDQQSLIQSITSLEQTESTPGHCRHESDYTNKRPLIVRFGLYGIINTIGVAIAIYGLYQCVLQIQG